MSARDVRALGLALCEALEALHAKGIVHRDIKPENVLVPSARAMEDACLVDMGLALSIDDPRAITAGGVVGTPGYLPPEQLSATPPAATPRWDVFSLGCVLYECATGAAPFGGSDRRDALARTACGPAPDPRTIVPTIQDDLASLLCAMIAPRAVERPEDGAAARVLLEAIARGDDAAPHGPPEPERFIAVILGHPTALGAPSSTTPAMIAPEDEASETLDRTMIPRGARVRTLGDGTLLLWLSSPALDRAFALRVVQCALLLADSRPDQRWSAAVSEGSSRNGWPVGPALDRALSMAQECEVGHVALDDAMSLLIDGAFALRARGNSRLIEARSALHSSS
jgi:serine/threonine protein kinase